MRYGSRSNTKKRMIKIIGSVRFTLLTVRLKRGTVTVALAVKRGTVKKSENSTDQFFALLSRSVPAHFGRCPSRPIGVDSIYSKAKLVDQKERFLVDQISRPSFLVDQNFSRILVDQLANEFWILSPFDHRNCTILKLYPKMTIIPLLSRICQLCPTFSSKILTKSYNGIYFYTPFLMPNSNLFTDLSYLI